MNIPDLPWWYYLVGIPFGLFISFCFYLGIRKNADGDYWLAARGVLMNMEKYLGRLVYQRWFLYVIFCFLFFVGAYLWPFTLIAITWGFSTETYKIFFRRRHPEDESIRYSEED